MACRRRDFGDDQRMRLELDRRLTEEAFALAEAIAAPVVEFARAHTTVAIERTVARLFGVDGVDELGVPLPNVLVDALGPRLGEGLALPLAQSCVGLGSLAAAGRRGGRRRRAAGLSPARRRRASWRSGSRPRATGGSCAAAVERDAMVGGPRRPADALAVRDRRHRRHPRGCPPGAGGGPGRRRRDRRHPLDGPEPARLRPLRRDDGGVRRHVRDAGELPARAGGARRGRSPRSGATCG